MPAFWDWISSSVSYQNWKVLLKSWKLQFKVSWGFFQKTCCQLLDRNQASLQQSLTLPLTSLRACRPVRSCPTNRNDGKSLSSDIKNNGEKKLCRSAIYPCERCQNLYYMLQGWENIYYGVGSFSADSNIPVQCCKFGYRKGW